MRYAIVVRRYVEQLASIVIEAADSDDAQRQVQKVIDDGLYEPKWEHREPDGDEKADIVDYHPALSSDQLTELP